MPGIVGSTTNVPIKSPWTSKINWTQLIGIGTTIAALFGLHLPPEQLVAVITGVQAAQAVVTVIIKTFFTKSVSAPSV